MPAQLETVVEQFWRRREYTVEEEGKVLLRKDVKMTRVWADFQVAFPQHVSLGKESFSDKTKVCGSRPLV